MAGADVVVIGGGIVGITAALALQAQGAKVTVLEAASPGGPQAASFGNGAFISPASVIPMSVPGLWRRLPGYLLDRSGPLTLRPAALPHLAPWLLRFLLAGRSMVRVEATATRLWDLLADAPARHAALAEAAGRPELIERRGLLYVWPDRAAREAEAPWWALRRRLGLDWQDLEGEALHRFEPALSAAYTEGRFVASGAHCRDPGGYVAALAAHFVARGGRLQRGSAQGFRHNAAGLQAVVTDEGLLLCGQAVIAAGWRSARLARLAGDRIPLESERGYHVEVATDLGLPQRPVMPADGKMANTVTASGFRASGQVELNFDEAAPDWRRADILLEHLYRCWPQLSRSAPVTRWQGNRPSTPDGLPVIGRASRLDGLFYAFGHGHVGLASAPRTAELLVQVMRGEPVAAAFSPQRF